jgi:hypothetical protein
MWDVYFETLIKLCKDIHNERRQMLMSSVVFFHDNVCPHTAAHTRASPALLENFNWKLFNQPPSGPDIAPSYYHLFTWFRSQLFNNELEGVEMWLSSDAYKNLFPNICPWPLAVTMLSNLCMYEFLVYNKFYFLIPWFVTSSQELTFQIASHIIQHEYGFAMVVHIHTMLYQKIQNIHLQDFLLSCVYKTFLVYYKHVSSYLG